MSQQISPARISDGLSAVPGGSNGQALQISDATGVVRVQLGALPSGGYGLRVTSADGVTVIIDGTSDVFKILASGGTSVLVTAGASATFTDTSLPGLGTWSVIPICVGVVSRSNALTGNRRQLGRDFNASSGFVAGVSGGSPTFKVVTSGTETSLGSWIDGATNYAVIEIGASNPGFGSDVTWYGKWYLLAEAAL